MQDPVHIFWFRRDPRLRDNAGLYQALKAGLPVVPVFIFDRHILERLDRVDARVEFICSALLDLQRELLEVGSTLDVRYGYPAEVFGDLLKEYDVRGVFA